MTQYGFYFDSTRCTGCKTCEMACKDYKDLPATIAFRKVYDYETKLAAVKEHVERGKSVRDVIVKYQIPSESSLKAWCRAYRRDGAHALVNKRRGRKPRSSAESSS